MGIMGIDIASDIFCIGSARISHVSLNANCIH